MLWLLLEFNQGYFIAALPPFSLHLFSLNSVVGLISLLVGFVWGILRKKRGLLVFIAPILASQGLVVLSGYTRGVLQPGTAEPLMFAFLLLQMGAAGFIVFKMKDARVPAAALALFTSSYAFHATFVATMAFTENWL